MFSTCSIIWITRNHSLHLNLMIGHLDHEKPVFEHVQLLVRIKKNGAQVLLFKAINFDIIFIRRACDKELVPVKFDTKAVVIPLYLVVGLSSGRNAHRNDEKI